MRDIEETIDVLRLIKEQAEAALKVYESDDYVGYALISIRDLAGDEAFELEEGEPPSPTGAEAVKPTDAEVTELLAQIDGAERVVAELEAGLRLRLLHTPEDCLAVARRTVAALERGAHDR